MKRIGSSVIYWAYLYCWVPASAAQQTNSFTVQQAVEYSMKNATQVKNALLDINVQEQVNRQDYSGCFSTGEWKYWRYALYEYS
jgi:hypothetical protein